MSALPSAPFPTGRGDLPSTGPLGLQAELSRTWASSPGLIGWLKEVDHKRIATRYIITAFGFFALGGVFALLMRIQLARPANTFVGPERYSQLFTIHGSTMVFLFIVPVMQAIGLYLVPLMIGTRNVAFPRLNAYGYFAYLIGGLFLWTSVLLGAADNAGWFSYVPLAESQFSPGKAVDVWAQMITFTELAALVAAIEIIVTTFKLRAPGMSLDRLPLIVWSMLVMAFMVVFAMPAVMVSSTMLGMDRLAGVNTRFFDPTLGGDALLWQHLFWYFGHPDVYIMFVPGLGFVSSIIATFSRRSIFGSIAIILSMIAVGFFGFGLWVHHMFATGLPQLGESFFTAASMMIAVPSGVQIFCWLATLCRGRLVIRTPLLFVLGFLVLFVIGGLTGVMLGSVPVDLQVHDTYFVVAHLHYVIIGGAVFPLFGAIYYWFPKMTGRMLSERAGRWNFWLLLLGFNVTFFPMHQLGLEGMPRRIYTYLPETHWGPLNLIATVGAFAIAASILVFAGNVAWSRRHGPPAGDNPWGADTLEWSTSSPPPPYNYAFLPVVDGAHPLWSRPANAPVVVGLHTEHREVLITTAHDARPSSRHVLPGPAIAPFFTALATGVTFIGGIFTPWAVVAGAVLTFATLTAWFWPTGRPSRASNIRAPATGHAP